MGKLEGPKRHHDKHGTYASQPSKGNAKAIPNDHWEKIYDATDASKNMVDVRGSDFNPTCPTTRKTTYIKVNKTDH